MTDMVNKPKDTSRFIQISRGSDHSLALDRDGWVWAWGCNRYEQCRVPRGMPPCTAIWAGNHHSLALDRDGRVWAWGLKSAGQCRVPRGMPPCTAISAGGFHSLALDRDGRVWAWGGGSNPRSVYPHGQCDVPERMPPCTAIWAGQEHSLALDRDGRVWVWGRMREVCADEVPWRLSDEGWLDMVIDYGNELALTCAIPNRIRRLPEYKGIRAMQRI